MSLPGFVKIGADRIRSLLKADEVPLNALRDLELRRPGGARDEVLHAITALKVTRMALNAEAQSILTCCAAAVMTGETPPPLQAHDLELHPRQLPAQVPTGALLASLHRAGDHTLDDEEGGQGVAGA